MHTHAQKHTQKKHSKFFFPPSRISATGLWESQRIVYHILYVKKKERGQHMFLRRSQKNSLNRQKKKVQKKLPPCEKGPCARLLPNVGVPKILPDRKFPILRCVLKSCSHSNAVTVILLTLIASLHPHSVPLSFSFREHCTFYLQYRAGLRCFTADSV